MRQVAILGVVISLAGAAACASRTPVPDRLSSTSRNRRSTPS